MTIISTALSRFAESECEWSQIGKIKSNSSCVKLEVLKIASLEDIQFTFGSEWLTYPDIMPEHEDEFALYFDLINIPDLKNMRVCDLGCGIGRWSYFLRDKCRELILLDFSEAIFAARKNLKESENALSM